MRKLLNRVDAPCGRLTIAATPVDACHDARTQFEGDRTLYIDPPAARNRLLVFAQRAAPIQVTYLGYPNTTGLQAMDFRLTDADSDPVGMTEHQYTERLARLPRGFLCYEAPDNAPQPRNPDSYSVTDVTFGCFNNLAKVTDIMLDCWARILASIPRSTLVLKAEGFSNEQTRDETLAAFGARGIAGVRIKLHKRTLSFQEHLRAYRGIDIALDTFPYNGTTTTCEALFMGVPVVTLAGRAHLSRVGASLLRRVNLPELIAQTHEEYARIAIFLACDASRRREIGLDLRQRMLTSDLMDSPRFTTDLEHVYLRMLTDS